MKLKKNDMQIVILFILIIAALAGYFVIKEVTENKDKNTSEDNALVLMQFKVGDVKKIEFNDYEKNKMYSMSKKDNIWKFSEPSTYIANPQACESYVNALVTINYDNRIQSPKNEDMELYGLKKQKKEIIIFEITANVEKKWTFAIGGSTPTGDKQYIYHREADIIYIMDNQYVTYLDTNIDDLRNKTIFSAIERERIAYVQFENKIDGIKNTFSLKDGKWIWEPNFVKKTFALDPADNSVTVLLDRLIYFSASKIIDDTKPLSYGEYTITVKNANGSLVIPLFIKDPQGDVPPEQRTYTLFNKMTKETFEATIAMLYTFFTPNPLNFSNLLTQQ